MYPTLVLWVVEMSYAQWNVYGWRLMVAEHPFSHIDSLQETRLASLPPKPFEVTEEDMKYENKQIYKPVTQNHV